MNIVRALEVALAELRERVVRNSPPKLDPRVIHKEHVENGQPVVVAKLPGTEYVFRFLLSQWQLIQLFDGKRSYGAIAEEFLDDTGIEVSEDEIRELVGSLQTETSLLYRTPVEQNVILQEELRSSRQKRKKSGIVDFSDITIKVWNNADGYITWLYPKVRFLFTPWFVWTSIAMFAVMGWMWTERFGEIWNDSFAFYNFLNKSSTDLIEFWFLFGAMAAIHETAHGLVGKHFGATIEKMGFTLMYFAPSFFCDAPQVWVKAVKWARVGPSLSITYAILSGLCSYSLLSFLMVITYHILRSFNPEWAFLPALGIGAWVFRSRIKQLVGFMRMLYLDKRERMRVWFTSVKLMVLITVAVMLTFAPIWPDFVQGPVVLRASQPASVRATLP